MLDFDKNKKIKRAGIAVLERGNVLSANSRSFNPNYDDYFGDDLKVPTVQDFYWQTAGTGNLRLYVLDPNKVVFNIEYRYNNRGGFDETDPWVNYAGSIAGDPIDPADTQHLDFEKQFDILAIPLNTKTNTFIQWRVHLRQGVVGNVEYVVGSGQWDSNLNPSVQYIEAILHPDRTVTIRYSGNDEDLKSIAFFPKVGSVPTLAELAALGTYSDTSVSPPVNRTNFYDFPNGETHIIWGNAPVDDTLFVRVALLNGTGWVGTEDISDVIRTDVILVLPPNSHVGEVVQAKTYQTGSEGFVEVFVRIYGVLLSAASSKEFRTHANGNIDGTESWSSSWESDVLTGNDRTLIAKVGLVDGNNIPYKHGSSIEYKIEYVIQGVTYTHQSVVYFDPDNRAEFLKSTQLEPDYLNGKMFFRWKLDTDGNSMAYKFEKNDSFFSGDPSFDIFNASVTSKLFQLEASYGDLTAEFNTVDTFRVDSGANAGVYSIASTSFVSGRTRITVNETVPSTTGVGKVVCDGPYWLPGEDIGPAGSNKGYFDAANNAGLNYGIVDLGSISVNEMIKIRARAFATDTLSDTDEADQNYGEEIHLSLPFGANDNDVIPRIVYFDYYIGNLAQGNQRIWVDYEVDDDSEGLEYKVDDGNVSTEPVSGTTKIAFTTKIDHQISDLLEIGSDYTFWVRAYNDTSGLTSVWQRRYFTNEADLLVEFSFGPATDEDPTHTDISFNVITAKNGVVDVDYDVTTSTSEPSPYTSSLNTQNIYVVLKPKIITNQNRSTTVITSSGITVTKRYFHIKIENADGDVLVPHTYVLIPSDESLDVTPSGSRVVASDWHDEIDITINDYEVPGNWTVSCTYGSGTATTMYRPSFRGSSGTEVVSGGEVVGIKYSFSTKTLALGDEGTSTTYNLEIYDENWDLIWSDTIVLVDV